VAVGQRDLLLGEAGGAQQQGVGARVLRVQAQLLPDELGALGAEVVVVVQSARTRLVDRGLDGVDGVLEKIAKKRGLPDDVWATLKGEKSSMKRVEMLEDKIIELRDSKDNATTKTEKGQLQKQIDDLQNELRQTKEAHNTALENERKAFGVKETGLMVDAILAQKNFANKDVPMNVNILTAKALIEQLLAKEGVVMVNRDGVIRILKQDGSDYYNQKHEKVDATSFFDGVLSGNKMLTITDPTKTGDNNNRGNRTVVTTDSNKKVDGNLLASNSASLAALSQAGYQ